jgi:hypothetical protein
MTEESWFDSRQGKIFICPPKRPGFTQPFIQWLAGFFPRGYSGQVVKLTTHFNILPNVRMSGAIPPLPHVLSWYAQGQLYLYVARFQASAALWMRYSLFWEFTQRRLVVRYRRFGTTYRPHLAGSSIPRRMLGTLRCPVIWGMVDSDIGNGGQWYREWWTVI